MENTMLIEALYNAYAGSISEMSAVSQYFYQSVVLDSNPSLHKTLEDISITEMRHLEDLAKILKDLGCLPYLTSYQYHTPIPWKSDNINYTTDYTQMILDDIKREEIAINGYNHILELTNCPKIKMTIQKIIEEEIEHIQILETLLPKAR